MGQGKRRRGEREIKGKKELIREREKGGGQGEGERREECRHKR